MNAPILYSLLVIATGSSNGSQPALTLQPNLTKQQCEINRRYVNGVINDGSRAYVRGYCLPETSARD